MPLVAVDTLALPIRPLSTEIWLHAHALLEREDDWRARASLLGHLRRVPEPDREDVAAAFRSEAQELIARNPIQARTLMDFFLRLGDGILPDTEVEAYRNKADEADRAHLAAVSAEGKALQVKAEKDLDELRRLAAE
jgi:hypothetical protein